MSVLESEVRGHRGCPGPAGGTTGGYDLEGPRGWKKWMHEGGLGEGLTGRQSVDEWPDSVGGIEQRTGSQRQGGVQWSGRDQGW